VLGRFEEPVGFLEERKCLLLRVFGDLVGPRPNRRRLGLRGRR
jgi:hypothetical protein